MGTVYETINDDIRSFIGDQPMFFVATAPLGETGHINLSPKGLDSFRILSDDEVAYLDLTGSGNETAAHLTENGRVTFMFCAFAGPPKIIRLYGRGDLVREGDPRWRVLRALFPEMPGVRQIVTARLFRVQTSCGFGVPRFELEEQRDTLVRLALAKGDDELVEYRRLNNAESIDGLPTARP